eukprot:NODE_17087_length_301_cov_3.206349_g15920_i0.p3 GENE.NODE_17087_length_301_cov_3.206349_g15920_i0~~NODE_17087_length_301_cov_3.206349_g15920_i0.p3  ORF type:complete len:50 (+),score=1.68 NODE_17087_length_301_cov_3.206349_g15920_i0:96-245(+)
MQTPNRAKRVQGAEGPLRPAEGRFAAYRRNEVPAVHERSERAGAEGPGN